MHGFSCYHGSYELVTRDQEYPMTDGSRRMIPRVNYLRCIECAEEVLTAESNRDLLGFGPPKVDVAALREEDEKARGREDGAGQIFLEGAEGGGERLFGDLTEISGTSRSRVRRIKAAAQTSGGSDSREGES